MDYHRSIWMMVLASTRVAAKEWCPKGVELVTLERQNCRRTEPRGVSQLCGASYFMNCITVACLSMPLAFEVSHSHPKLSPEPLSRTLLQPSTRWLRDRQS